MGLDTTHDCWHGSYSSFNWWRKTIAKVAGLPNLDDMDGFGGSIKWESLEPDVLHELLNHSDCDGEIRHEVCGPLADRLEELLPMLKDQLPLWTGRYTEQFIAGLRDASNAGENVEFR